MHDWMNGWGMGFGFFFWLLLLALIIVGVVWLVRSQSSVGERSGERRSTALDLLQERYARGEIGHDEHLQKKNDLSD